MDDLIRLPFGNDKTSVFPVGVVLLSEAQLQVLLLVEGHADEARDHDQRIDGQEG